MAGFVLPSPKFQAFDNNGAPLAGGRVYFYVAGTSTPANTYADSALTVLNSNPVILDAAGRATIFVPDSSVHLFKVVVNDANDALIYSVDGVSIPDTTPPAPVPPMPVGSIIAYGGTSAPPLWLLCDGSAWSRTTYGALFAVIDVWYGPGSGSTFNVPDLRQRFPLGKAVSGTGVVLGSTGGVIDHKHTGPDHTHGIGALMTGGDHVHTTGPIVDDGGSLILGGGVGSGTQHHHAVASSGAHLHAGNTNLAGTGFTSESNPPWQSVNYIIYAGV